MTFYKGIARHFRNEAIKKRCIASAYVEYYEDVTFWQSVIGVPRINFKCFVKTGKNLKAAGSGQALLFHQYGLLSEKFFICIDSDYRYLLQEKDLDITHFIFQTYTYSIENHKCYAESLTEMGKNAFNFSAFLQDFSRIVYPLFIQSVYSAKKKDNQLSIRDFSHVFHLQQRTDISENGKVELSFLREKIGNELSKYSENAELERLKIALNTLGVMEDNVYLFLRGHDVYDKVVLPILKRIQHEKLVQMPEKERNNIPSISKGLANNFHFLHHNYPELNKIKQDIQTFFA